MCFKILFLTLLFRLCLSKHIAVDGCPFQQHLSDDERVCDCQTVDWIVCKTDINATTVSDRRLPNIHDNFIKITDLYSRGDPVFTQFKKVTVEDVHQHLYEVREFPMTKHTMDTTNLFEGFKFKTIEFKTPLKSIPKHFFIGCTQTTKSMTIYDYDTLFDDVYHGLSHFAKLTSLTVRHTGPHEIESNSFASFVKRQMALKEVTYKETSDISRSDRLGVYKDAFADLTQLTLIDLSRHKPKECEVMLDSFAFRMPNRNSNEILTIRIQLAENIDSFLNPKSFAGLDDVIDVRLEIHNEKYKPASDLDLFFEPFLKGQFGHRIEFVKGVVVEKADCHGGLFKLESFIQNGQIVGQCLFEGQKLTLRQCLDECNKK